MLCALPFSLTLAIVTDASTALGMTLAGASLARRSVRRRLAPAGLSGRQPERSPYREPVFCRVRLTLSPRSESLGWGGRDHASVPARHYPKRSGRATVRPAAEVIPSSVLAAMRTRRERAVMRGRPASIDKAATVRKCDELGRLSVYDGRGWLNVGDSLWRRIISLNYRRFLSHLGVRRRHRGAGTVRKTGAGLTPRSDLLIVQPRRLSPVPLDCLR